LNIAEIIMVTPGTYNGKVAQLFTTGASGPSNAWMFLSGTGPTGTFNGWIRFNPVSSDIVTNMLVIATAASHAQTYVTATVGASGNVEVLYG
jgi:hypothetical protein